MGDGAERGRMDPFPFKDIGQPAEPSLTGSPSAFWIHTVQNQTPLRCAERIVHSRLSGRIRKTPCEFTVVMIPQGKMNRHIDPAL